MAHRIGNNRDRLYLPWLSPSLAQNPPPSRHAGDCLTLLVVIVALFIIALCYAVDEDSAHTHSKTPCKRDLLPLSWQTRRAGTWTVCARGKWVHYKFGTIRFLERSKAHKKVCVDESHAEAGYSNLYGKPVVRPAIMPRIKIHRNPSTLMWRSCSDTLVLPPYPSKLLPWGTPGCCLVVVATGIIPEIYSILSHSLYIHLSKWEGRQCSHLYSNYTCTFTCGCVCTGMLKAGANCVWVSLLKMNRVWIPSFGNRPHYHP